jgi:pteridine reductase
VSERQVALITGAARRLGAATAKVLHEQGYDVAIHFHTSAEEASALAAELNQKRLGSAITLAQDLAASDAATRLIALFRKHYQRLDLLVNNASIFDRTPIESDCTEAWDRIHTVNLRTPYLLTLAAAPLLRVTGGSAVNIADIHAERPRADYSAYCISKAGLVAATHALALDLAPHIRVNCVAPGAILWASSEDADVQAKTLDGTPLGRHGDPADIAQAVVYLARAPFITGHVINVDGGRSLHL